MSTFNLSKWVGQEEARLKLVQAGYRGQAPYVTFLFIRMITPIAAFLFAVMYLFVLLKLDYPNMVKIGICIGAAYIGMHLPLLLLKNKIKRRQLSIKRAFPDTFDLLLICVESGMSIEAAFRKVSDEAGTIRGAGGRTHVDDRRTVLSAGPPPGLRESRQANGSRRREVGLLALQQAERYSTPLATMLRVMAQENRDMRMSEAEKKAAGLPPKLTVPMILFFLPVLFVVILGPAAIKVMALQ